MSQRPLLFIIIPIPAGLSRGRTTKASLCEGGGSAKRWRRERRHAVFLSPSRLRRQPPHRGGCRRCHSEPVTVSLAWESVLSFVGKRIAAPVCGLARNDKVRRGRRPRRPVSAALPRWKRIAAPVCTPRALASRRGLARNDKVRRGGRLCPPRMTAAPGRAGPCVPPQNTAFVPAGHTGPALQGGSTDSRRKKRKPLRAFFFCI